MASAGEAAVVDASGIAFNYRVEYQGNLARLSVVVNIGADGSIGGIGKVSWSRL
jgi:hypothetical protein